MTPGWPVVLSHGGVVVRPLRLRDARRWSEVRTRNRRWLQPWEGASPSAQPATWESRHSPAVFTALLSQQRREARAGRGMAFAIEVEERLVGQVTVSGLVRGAFESATLGYWVDRDVAGRGVVPTAVALVVDHLLGPVGLHRVQVDVRPDNAPSLRVVEKLGLRPEGRHERYLFIDGAWRDHLTFAVVAEDVPQGLLHRYLRSREDTPPHLHQE